MTLKILLDQRNIKQIEILFNRYCDLIETYRNKAVLKYIINDIDDQIRDSRKFQLHRLLDSIDKVEVDIFVSLHPNKCSIIRDYLVGKLILYLLNKYQINIRIEGEEITKLKKNTDLHEYKEFHELIKFGSESNIENEGDML